MSLMVPDPALVESGDSLEQYFQMARQFFQATRSVSLARE